MILVVGGTGRLGSQIVRVVRSVGLDCRCLVRKGSEYFWLNDTGTNYFFGDLRDPKSLSRSLRDVKHVIAAAGVRVERTDNNHKNMTVDGHLALWEAAKARGVEHVVFVSCAGAGDPGDVPLFVAKKTAEDALIASGLAYTIFRPGLFAANFADLARRSEYNGSVFLPGKEDTQVTPIHGRDLALMCLGATEAPEARNRIFEVGGAETLTVKEAFERTCRVAGIEPNYWPLPPTGLRALGMLAKPLISRWANHFKALEGQFAHDHVVDGKAIADLFGIELTSFDEAAKDAWANRHPSEDPLAREEKVVHRQFVATIYEPGTAKLADLPDGPPPRQD
jgi:uncharacterized protein YbjT (DUF2867 family)